MFKSGFQFHQFRGFKSFLSTAEGAEVILNAMRSLLLLDGSPSSLEKVRKMDDGPKGTSPSQCLQNLLGDDIGYVLTGDNLTKMMFALYRLRCHLPVVVFGGAGVG